MFKRLKETAKKENILKEIGSRRNEDNVDNDNLKQKLKLKIKNFKFLRKFPL